MGITTYDGRVSRALDAKTNKVFWCAIGQTSDWASEPTPDAEDPDTSSIAEEIVYVKVTTISLCKTVTSGEDIVVGGQKFAYVSDGNAYTEAARYLYLKFDFDGDTHPTGNFRQHGVYTDLTPAGGYESDVWLAPANVSDEGTLEYFENHTVKTFGTGEQREIHIVVEFR